MSLWLRARKISALPCPSIASSPRFCRSKRPWRRPKTTSLSYILEPLCQQKSAEHYRAQNIENIFEGRGIEKYRDGQKRGDQVGKWAGVAEKVDCVRIFLADRFEEVAFAHDFDHGGADAGNE